MNLKWSVTSSESRDNFFRFINRICTDRPPNQRAHSCRSSSVPVANGFKLTVKWIHQANTNFIQRNVGNSFCSAVFAGYFDDHVYPWVIATTSLPVADITWDVPLFLPNLVQINDHKHNYLQKEWHITDIRVLCVTWFGFWVFGHFERVLHNCIK